MERGSIPKSYQIHADLATRARDASRIHIVMGDWVLALIMAEAAVWHCDRAGAACPDHLREEAQSLESEAFGKEPEP